MKEITFRPLKASVVPIEDKNLILREMTLFLRMTLATQRGKNKLAVAGYRGGKLS
jgi:hypothetical protein